MHTYITQQYGDYGGGGGDYGGGYNNGGSGRTDPRSRLQRRGPQAPASSEPPPSAFEPDVRAVAMPL